MHFRPWEKKGGKDVPEVSGEIWDGGFLFSLSCGMAVGALLDLASFPG